MKAVRALSEGQQPPSFSTPPVHISFSALAPCSKEEVRRNFAAFVRIPRRGVKFRWLRKIVGLTDESASLPAKRAKTDSWSASLKFLATVAVTPVPPADSDFDRFLAAPVSSGVDTLGWSWKHAAAFPAIASVARQFVFIPATLTQSERQFSTASRLGHHERAFCMHGGLLNDRLITDYHITMIGYGKKLVSHP